MDKTLKLLAVILVGFLATFVVGRLIVVDRNSTESDGPLLTTFPAIYHDPSAASDLIDAWRTWRTATFVVRGTWTRTLDSGGSPLTGPTYAAQDPPRRVVQRLGETLELFDGRVGMSYDERVTAELATVVDYVTGNTRIYSVDYGRIDGCFRAELEVVAIGSPWGRWAEFCFDAESGAMLSSRVRRQSAVDVEVNTVVGTTVADTDFPGNS